VVGDYLPRPRSRWLTWVARVRALWRGPQVQRRLRG
jgi:hypothetical protein